jgi:MerR family transcriptional regulator, light-induced transcriptional regulator
MQFVSPRQLARAAGVSESSVKRWCDQGLIPTVKTAGGHRRLTLDAAAEFLRESYPDAKPELLGLPPRPRIKERAGRNMADELASRLIAGDEEACRQLLLDLHFAGERASRIGDAVIAPAFCRIGAGWECHDVEVYQERLACGIVQRTLAEMKSIVPAPRKGAPLAIGGTSDEDPYTLPTALVEIVMQQCGWQSLSLGTRLPFPTLLAAIRSKAPQLFWLSVSHIDDEHRFLTEYDDFYARIHHDVAVVVGGRALSESLRQQMQYAAYCDNLQHLEAFAKALKRSPAEGRAVRNARSSNR